MRISPVIIVAIGLWLICFEHVDGQRRRNRRRRRVNFAERRARLSQNLDGSVEFPRELQYRMAIEGQATQELNLQLNPFIQMPNEKGRKKRKYAFYTETSTGEPFACKVKRRKGRMNCQLSGILERNAETCFVSPSSNMAECESNSDVTEGVLEAVDDYNNPLTEVRSNSKRNIDPVRETRSIYPEEGFKTVEVTFVADGPFMQPFYERNPTNDQAAEEEAELFATLLANEMSTFYRSVKDVSSGQLDLVLFPSAFVHPGKNNNFAWSQDNTINTNILNATSGLPEFANFVYNSLTGTAFQADHIMGLSGLDLLSVKSGTNLLGIAYLFTVCRPNSSKVSLQENRGTNLGWIAAHELGHALGASHDQTTECPTRTNVMSSVIFNPTSSNQNTYSKFSSCSVDYFTSHLNNYPDCLSNNGFTEEQFRDSFCRGFLGSLDMSLDRQCQVRTGSTTASACVSSVSTSACYLAFQVPCRSSPTSSCSSTLRFVWNGTPCGSSGNVCFGGFCVPEFDICEANSTTTNAPTTTMAPTTMARTTAAPTTVAPTTVAPTTVAPTTVAPTTAEPTTVAPTTVAPTTVAPTTVAPTTAVPTSAAPTTVTPTTAEPTTVAPTTVAPTTATPTTVAPTTVTPTTVAPTTVAPTTVAPTTAAPTTVAPTTVAPTSVAPTTVAPTTVAPTTKAPSTSAPTTVAPTTVAPTTVVRTTVAPTTIAPTTVTPTTVAPTTKAHTTAAPITVAPTTVAPTTVVPTTVAPTTVASTTIAPSTLAPTTAAPTTVAPTTVATTTVAHTTVEPTTVAPTTNASTTVVTTSVAATTVAATPVASTSTLGPPALTPDGRTSTVAPTTVAPTTVAPTTVTPTTVAPSTVASTSTLAPPTLTPDGRTSTITTTFGNTISTPTTEEPECTCCGINRRRRKRRCCRNGYQIGVTCDCCEPLPECTCCGLSRRGRRRCCRRATNSGQQCDCCPRFIEEPDDVEEEKEEREKDD